MARNSEKAMTTLARWRAAHIETKKDKEIRPYLATECDDLKKAEKFRRHIISEISKKVAQIQNAGMGEFKLRDLNDDINKLLREKGHWEDRIKDLGGPDYRKIGPKMLDHEGKEIPGNRGYKYFGAAKDLPGVKELFEQIAPPPSKKTRAELMRDINADYYGYRDEDDGLLVELESEKEIETIRELLKRKDRNSEKEIETDLAGDDDDNNSDNVLNVLKKSDVKLTFTGHINVPSQKDIENALVERKKMELLQRYASDSLIHGQEETKKLLL